MTADVQAESDVQEGVDRLVEEIDRAVGVVERLRVEKDELNERVRQLEGRLEQQAAELTEARSERERFQRIVDENSSLIENRGAIQSKIDSMLSRLDALHAS